MAQRDLRNGRLFVYEEGAKRYLCIVAECTGLATKTGRCVSHSGMRKKCADKSCSNMATGKSAKCEEHVKCPVADEVDSARDGCNHGEHIKCSTAVNCNHAHDDKHGESRARDHANEPDPVPLPGKSSPGSKSWTRGTHLQPAEKRKLKPHPGTSLCIAKDCQNSSRGGDKCTTHAPKLCIIKGCKSGVRKKKMCKKHSKMGNPICTVDGCGIGVRRNGVCSEHTVKVKTCSVEGCTKLARKGGKCKPHAGVKPKKCSVEGCENVQQKGGKCAKHAEMKKKMCAVEGCGKGAWKPSDKCMKHTDIADKTCSVDGCMFIARKKGMCITHAGGKKSEKCSIDGCKNKAVRKGANCDKHSEVKKKRSKCIIPGCTVDACRAGKLCTKHARVKCATKDCDKCAMKAGKCLRCYGHTCIVDGCTKLIQRDKKCQKHAGIIPKKCGVTGCKNGANVNGICRRHAGIIRKKCIVEGCKKIEQMDKKCAEHAGYIPKRCSVDGCTSKVESKGLCQRHGGGKRCKLDDCNRRSITLSDYCIEHSTAEQIADYKKVKQCKYEDCDETRIYYSDYCFGHSTQEQVDYVRKARQAQSKAYYKKNPDKKIARSISSRIRQSLKKQMSSREYTGCDYDTLKAHIEAQFVDDMCWENYGQYGWHLDHIKPVSAFDLSDPAEALACFNYKNLQPLWWYDNLSKSDTYYPADDDADDDELGDDGEMAAKIDYLFATSSALTKVEILARNRIANLTKAAKVAKKKAIATKKIAKVINPPKAKTITKTVTKVVKMPKVVKPKTVK